MRGNLFERLGTSFALLGATITGTYLTIDLAISSTESSALKERQLWEKNLLPLKKEALERLKSPSNDEEKQRLDQVVARVDEAEKRIQATEKDVMDMKISWAATQHRVESFFGL
ncbi:hypothetical protein THRCLA_20517 [Thraustotheca clavata]|uniref:Uncharacterized protein n=1 Tax=Thraustotheca clavata TaxID=74557 RepID=A0A1W0A6J5_9STRA|nr:hypothetical protein THRCLA_20517 [Thraustotheca clavata]